MLHIKSSIENVRKITIRSTSQQTLSTHIIQYITFIRVSYVLLNFVYSCALKFKIASVYTMNT